MLAVTGARHRSRSGTRSRKQTFKLDGGHHVLVEAVAELAADGWVEHFDARRKNHRADLYLFFFDRMGVVDGSHAADRLTGAALAGIESDAAGLVDDRHPGYCLGIKYIDRLARVEPFVEPVEQRSGRLVGELGDIEKIDRAD